MLINGETSGFNSYDNTSFFNDAHVSGDSGNQDNKLGASATASTDPTVAEFKTALRAAIAAMVQTKSVEFNRGSSPEGLVRPFRRAIDRGSNRQRITDILARETSVATSSATTRQALNELDTSGANVNIRDFISGLPGFEGENAAELAPIVQGLRAIRGKSLKFGRDS
ncbi:MAG: hypothetical protein AABZ47_11320 [Planctomycetota bacterium]